MVPALNRVPGARRYRLQSWYAVRYHVSKHILAASTTGTTGTAQIGRWRNCDFLFSLYGAIGTGLRGEAKGILQAR